MRAHDVGYGKVEDRAGMVVLRLLGMAEHEAHATAVEESKGARGEQ